MQATVTVDVNIEHARTALRMAGFKVDGRSNEESCWQDPTTLSSR